MVQRTIRFEGAKLYPKQKAAIYDPARVVLIEASTKAGKAQPLDALIQTPTGPKRMGDIRLGDQVFTLDGVTTVRGIYPQGKQDIYRVSFSDGTSAECSEDHLWEVNNQTNGLSWPKVLPLSELMKFPQKRLKRLWIPIAEPVEYTTYVGSAYLLAALIGDGGFTTETLRFSSVDPEVLERVAKDLPGDCRLSFTDRCNYSIVSNERGNAAISWLRELELWGKGSHEKFVPLLFKRSQIECRWEFVRGLMDTDGFVDKRGQPGFDTTSEKLANDFVELIQSLGGIVRIGTKIGSYRAASGERIWCKRVYRCRITHPDASLFFHLQRKKNLCRKKSKPMKRTFRSIEFIRRAEAQCIELNSARGLYLTDNFIVTHNTVGCLAWFIEQGLKAKEGQNLWWVAPIFSQSEIAFRRCWGYLTPIRPMCKRNKSSMFIMLPNGARLMFKSGDRPDDLYGEDVYAAVLDEASRMREESWHAIRSTITFTKAPVRIIGNVRGRKNWFYRLARLAETGAEDMAFHRITAADAVEAGVLDKAEIEGARRDFERLGQEDVFRQLYMAEALDDASNPFGLQAIEACIVPAFSKARAIAAGVDLAGRGAVNIERVGDAESRDWTAICMLDKDGHMTYLDRFRKPHRETANEIVQKVKRVRALVDSTGTGDAIVEDLQRRGDVQVLGFTFTERSRQDLLEGLALAIQEGSVSFPDVKTRDGKGSLREELEAFEYQYTVKGVRYDVSEGNSDDLVMALALAVKRLPWRRQTRMKPAIVPVVDSHQWNSKADSPESAAWQKYQESLKPTLQPLPTEKHTEPVPMVIVGSGKNRWSGGG